MLERKANKRILFYNNILDTFKYIYAVIHTLTQYTFFIDYFVRILLSLP